MSLAACFVPSVWGSLSQHAELSGMTLSWKGQSVYVRQKSDDESIDAPKISRSYMKMTCVLDNTNVIMPIHSNI